MRGNCCWHMSRLRGVTFAIQIDYFSDRFSEEYFNTVFPCKNIRQFQLKRKRYVMQRYKRHYDQGRPVRELGDA